MMKRRFYLLLALALGLCAASARAGLLPLRSGTSPSGGGSTQACDLGGSGVCALFQSGQTFVTWPDAATGATGATFRYRLYRSNSPITSGNYTSATLIASYMLNNSGQLFGGDPTNASTALTAAFSQTYRQTSTRPMVPLSVSGSPITNGTGLQVYTALGSENAYYAVVSTDTSNGSPNYIGSVGPIAESVATPQPLNVALSPSRGQAYGVINATITNIPVVFVAHGSDASGGCVDQSCQYGDYWTFFLPAADGALWNDGRQTTLDVLLDKAQNYRQNTLVISDRDTIWDPLGDPTGSAGMETFHQGIGMTPNALVGSANRLYRGTAKGIYRMLLWAQSHYSFDANQLHWSGVSMGAWGGANTGLHATSPKFSAIWVSMPQFRMDHRNNAGWAGNTWTSSMPFKATTAAAPSTLGTNAATVLLDDGTTWGGTGGYADIPTFVSSSPGTDLSVFNWMTSKNDPFTTWSDELAAKDGFKAANRGHNFVWFMGLHDTGFQGRGAIDCDWSGHEDAVCYHKSDYKLNAPYIAFANSSIDDNPGDGGTNSDGTFNGDPVGCINCGFKWNVTSDTAGGFNFTVSNAWMGLAATTVPSTTISGSPSTAACSGAGTVALTDSTFGGKLLNIVGTNNGNPYFKIGTGATAEVFLSTGISGGNLNYSSRCLLGTGLHSHSASDPILQFPSQPTGPNAGAVSTMTVDMTPRRVQSFVPGATVHCTGSSNGGTSINQTVTVTSGVWTLIGVPIDATGVTTLACS